MHGDVPNEEATNPMLKFNRVAIRDPWVNNIEGATLLVPDGWAVEGGFHWLPLFSIQANLLIRVSDPRTGASVETLPTQQYVWSNQPMQEPIPIGANWLGSVHLNPPRHPAEYVYGIWTPDVLRRLSGARLMRVDDLPQYAAESSRAFGGAWLVQATRLRYAYGYGGREWEEDVYLTILIDQTDWRIIIWQAFGHAQRAPAGQLDKMTPLLSVPTQTLRLTLEWSAMLNHVRRAYREGRQRMMDNQKRLGQEWAQYREWECQQHRQVYEERQAAQDRQNFALREVLGGVETYKDPFGARAVELPAGFQDYWVSNKGDIICSEDAGFDPHSDHTAMWQRMERHRPHTAPPAPWGRVNS